LIDNFLSDHKNNLSYYIWNCRYHHCHYEPAIAAATESRSAAAAAVDPRACGGGGGAAPVGGGIAWISSCARPVPWRPAKREEEGRGWWEMGRRDGAKKYVGFDMVRVFGE
jgi:hypothetical protein